MLKEIDKEDLDKARILHDKIKNHLFRKSPEKYLLDEYAQLFEDVNDVIGRYVGEEYDEENHDWKYKYYRWVRDRWLHYRERNFKDGYFHFNDTAEIFTNPNIAIMDYEMHDFRAILWKLKNNWDSPSLHADSYGRFTEITEGILTVLHSLINGELIATMKFPSTQSFSTDCCTYEMVQNPLYDNDWTLEKYLHREWWEDKGYTDIEGDVTYTNEIIK